MDEYMRNEMIAAYKRNWSLIPLHKNDKKAKLPKGNDFLHRKATKEEYKSFKFGNYGVVCGKISGITVLDVDVDKGGYETLERNDVSFTVNIETPHVHTPGGMHIYFAYDPNIRTGANVIGPGVDVRNDGSYVVGAGSVINDKHYVWDDVYHREIPLSIAPDWMRMPTTAGETYKDDRAWKMPEKVSEGGRNNKLTSLAGALVLREIPYPVMVQTMLHINKIWFEPPLPQSEVLSIAESIERRR